MQQTSLHIRDNYIDKANYNDGYAYESKEQLQKAIQFFDQLPKVGSLDFPKTRCPSCDHPKKIYCLKCNVLLHDKQLVPQIVLPVTLRIIHHCKERHQKSSILPVQFLSEQVEVHSFPIGGTPPIYGDNDYILYPHAKSRLLSELSVSEMASMKSITAIDCTWRQSNQILKFMEEDIAGVRKYIRLGDYETYFWRYQHHSLKCLATVEAAYYFFKEYKQLTQSELPVETLLHFYHISFELIKANNDLEGTNVYEKSQDKKDRRLKQKIQLKEQQKLAKCETINN